MEPHRLALAGLRIRLRSPFPDGVGGLPRAWEDHREDAPADADAPPGLELELHHDPSLDARPHRPDHPRFSRHLDRGALVVERADARGRVELSAPVRARFEVSSDRYAVEACLRVALSVALPRHGALILHASAVERDGRAVAFSGVSGAGKSTIAALLDGVGDIRRLADELLIVRAAGGDRPWTAQTPPFLAVAGLPLGRAVPLASVELLAQAPHHRRTALPPGPALRELLRHVVVYAAEPETTERVLALACRLVAELPCHRLEFARDPGVAGVLGLA